MSLRTSPWVVVLAGGDGRRLASISRDPAGRPAPKQFCDFGAGATLLHRTLRRAARLTTPRRVVVVVQDAHRQWWRAERAAPGCHVLVEPRNRGTATAVLRGLRHVLAMESDPRLLFMPADHEVLNEPAWDDTLRRALDRAAVWPDQLVLVGMPPETDPGYGWIVSGPHDFDGTCPVASFVEKPDAAALKPLLGRGALRSTFVFASRATPLLALYRRHAPGLLSRLAPDAGRERRPQPSLETLPYCDFSRDLLQRDPERARVLSGATCGWTDLGTPERLGQWRVARVHRPRGIASAVPELLSA